MATFINTYTSAQTSLDIITPSSGKKIYLWQVVLSAENGAELKFEDSNQVVTKVTGIGQSGIMNPNVEGSADEPLSLTCGADTTTVRILYDEV